MHYEGERWFADVKKIVSRTNQLYTSLFTTGNTTRVITSNQRYHHILRLCGNIFFSSGYIWRNRNRHIYKTVFWRLYRVSQKSGTLDFRYIDIRNYSIFWFHQIKHCLLKRMIPRSVDLVQYWLQAPQKMSQIWMNSLLSWIHAVQTLWEF